MDESQEDMICQNCLPTYNLKITKERFSYGMVLMVCNADGQSKIEDMTQIFNIKSSEDSEPLDTTVHENSMLADIHTSYATDGKCQKMIVNDEDMWMTLGVLDQD